MNKITEHVFLGDITAASNKSHLLTNVKPFILENYTYFNRRCRSTSFVSKSNAFNSRSLNTNVLKHWTCPDRTYSLIFPAVFLLWKVLLKAVETFLFIAMQAFQGQAP